MLFKRSALRAPLLATVGAFSALALAAAIGTGAELNYREKVVAGGPDKFVEVRHIFMKGTNLAIGKKIGEIAAAYGTPSFETGDPLTNRVQREYMELNYPIMYERMRGLAEAFGLSIDDDQYDFSGVSQFPVGPPGCSAVFYPGTHTENGHGILSRNYDFTTGTITGQFPREGEHAVMSRPYIFELHPDEGYASIALCAFELLGGVLDGINEKGLAVAIFGDDDTVVRHGRHPSLGIGLHELMSMRYLLDNCGNAAEAKQALMMHKHFYSFIPCHYLIADREGNSFAFEFPPRRNGARIVDGDGPQCVTNHLLSQYGSIEEFPDDVPIDTFERYKTLHDAVTGRDKFTIEEIKAINAKVSSTAAAFDNPDRPPGRTLWHAIYDTSELSLRVKFYLGERPDPSNPAKKIIVYSDYVELKL